MADPVFCGEIRKAKHSTAGTHGPADADDWLDTERVLNEVQLGARLLRDMRLRGIFKGSPR